MMAQPGIEAPGDFAVDGSDPSVAQAIMKGLATQADPAALQLIPNAADEDVALGRPGQFMWRPRGLPG